MIAFAQTCAAIAATAGKLEKTRLLAAYLRGLDDADLEAATRFFTGNPFPQRDDATLAVGGRTIVAAARAVWGFSDAELSAAYRDSGDLGSALGRFVRPPLDLGLFRDPLAPSTLKTLLDQIAGASGKAANRRRQALCERIFSACTERLEATYVVKILTGDLRIGLREGLVLDGIAEAFGAPAADVRRALMAAGDAGTVARAARAGALAEVEVRYGSPVAFMLASPLAYGSSYKELAAGTWICEDKYDGIRVQVHKSAGTVRLYSRALNDVAAAFPEVVAALAETAGDCILDGELLALRAGRVLPFRSLQTRLQRKDPSLDLQREVPVQYVAFDLLARGAQFMLDEPLASRRAALAETVRPGPRVAIAPWLTLETGATPERLHELFDAARERGHEGLIFKRSDSPYQPGKRGKGWLKLKRELTTLDVLVVGVEWGHGKRAQMLSDYTFAVRGARGELLPIGKAYSGLTDAEIAEMTQWFLAHRLPEERAALAYAELGLRRHEIVVEPATVIEVAFDVVQRSALHKSGFSLRFPRIVRLRPDRSPADIATLSDVERIHAEMLRREDGSAIMGP